MGDELAPEVAEVVKVIRESGLPNHTYSMFTEIEGEWDEVMRVVKDATFILAEKGIRTEVILKADVRPGRTNMMSRKVDAVNEILEQGNSMRKNLDISAYSVIGPENTMGRPVSDVITRLCALDSPVCKFAQRNVRLAILLRIPSKRLMLLLQRGKANRLRFWWTTDWMLPWLHVKRGKSRWRACRPNRYSSRSMSQAPRSGFNRGSFRSC